MPNSNESERMQSRALLPFLGTFISSVTGLALQSDLEKLQANIVQIADFVNKETNVSSKFVSDTTVLVKLTNTRVDNLIDEMNNRSLTTLKLIEQIDSDNTQLVDFYANLTLHKFKFLASLTEMTTHYSNFLTAIGTLSRGHLPAFLFTETILTNMLDTVQTSVNKEFGKSIEIVHKHVHYYYNKGSFICTRHQDNLYITLKIPLTNIPNQFRLYRIQNLPYPPSQK